MADISETEGVRGESAPTAVYMPREDLRHHRLFIRAMRSGWNIPLQVKQDMVERMYRIITHQGNIIPGEFEEDGTPKRKRPNVRHQVHAARVLTVFAQLDNKVFLECLAELHRRERDGFEPDMFADESFGGKPTTQPPDKDSPTLAIPEFGPETVPPTITSDSGQTMTKELSGAAILEYYRTLHPDEIGELLRDRNP